ncbi:GOLPH3/VPS74 family protein [Antribacter gilvus]|uniref:GOLPH3/VPS74 family protein n=1 Tax=Antribacter gilvus TaxID=2304675 RepID=UPI000F782CFC|nr:GPP34 family phosphoprotein [Antribacter gilvus]
MLTLAEEFLLLALDDTTGRPIVDSTRLHAAIAGAALVDLTLQGSLEVAEHDTDVRRGRFRRTGQADLHDPLLAQILEDAHGRKPKDAVSRVSGQSSFRNQAGRLKDLLLARLAEQGVLRPEPARILGIFPTTAWKPHTPEVEGAIRDRVRAALVAPAPDPRPVTDAPPAPADLLDPRTAALVSLLAATDLTHRVVPDLDKRAVRRRAKEIAAAGWAGPAVKRVLDDTTAAMTAIIASTAAAGAAAGS